MVNICPRSKVAKAFIIIGSMCGIGWFFRHYFRPGVMKEEESSIEALANEDNADQNDAISAPVKELYNFSSMKTLRDFGYDFNENGELRDKEGNRFEFKLKDDPAFNQKRYEAIGEVITEHVYTLLEDDAGLKRVTVPIDVADDQPSGFVFVSDDFKTNKDKLMVLIHGSGVVRAGQWARRLIINDDLSCGTQLPYIERARQEGYAIIVLNSNFNSVMVDGEMQPIRDNASPEQHGLYVWQNLIKPLAVKHIAIVAHSYGGIVTTTMANENADEFEKRVFAIAFTDSVHSLEWQQAPETVMQLYKKRAINWVTSDEKVDTPLRRPQHDAPRLSAGHEKHEWTSSAAFKSVFAFFDKMYSVAVKSEL